MEQASIVIDPAFVIGPVRRRTRVGPGRVAPRVARGKVQGHDPNAVARDRDDHGGGCRHENTPSARERPCRRREG